MATDTYSNTMSSTRSHSLHTQFSGTCLAAKMHLLWNDLTQLEHFTGAFFFAQTQQYKSNESFDMISLE